MTTPHPIRAALFLVAGATFIAALPAIGARATYGARTTADEPQYLMTALSLGEDFALDISDEIAQGQFRSFHEVNLNPQTIDLNSSGQRLSPHDPLLPLLLAIPMRLGGWAAAKATLAAIAAATAAATLWLAVRRFDVSVRVGTVVVTAFFLSPPMLSYATQVYPEMPAALCVVVGLSAITGPLDRRAQGVALVSLVALPWLAIKYAPVAAVLAVAMLTRLWRHDRAAALSRLALLGAAGVTYLVVHQRIYGGWSVYASGDHFVGGQLQVIGENPNYVGRSRRLVGLLIDRGFGLMAWTPSFALVPAAIAATLRSRAWSATLLVATVVVGWAVATWVALTMHGWWWPGRQLVVILPAAIVAVAVVAERIRSLLIPVVVGGTLGFTSWLWLVVEASTGRRTLIVDFEQTSNPWYRTWSTLLPDHRNFDTRAIVLTCAWVALLGTFSAFVWLRSRPEKPAHSTDEPRSSGSNKSASPQLASAVASPGPLER